MSKWMTQRNEKRRLRYVMEKCILSYDEVLVFLSADAVASVVMV